MQITGNYTINQSTDRADSHLGLSASGARGPTPQSTGAGSYPLEWTSKGPGSNLEGGTTRGGRSTRARPNSLSPVENSDLLISSDSARRDLRHHQTQVSRRCTDGCTGAAPQLERTSGWGYSLGANSIRRQEPRSRCPDRCCDSQRIRCTRTARRHPTSSTCWSSLFHELVFPVLHRKFPVRPNKFPVPWRREFETETP